MLGSSSSWSGGFLPVTDYDINIGFGRVNLITTLPLRGENGIIAEIHDRVSISNAQSDEHEFDTSQCENANGVSATIVWTDPPSSSGCSNCVLNDLDLKMEVGSNTYFPNGLSSVDSTNNSERIRQVVADNTLVKFTVTASNLLANYQNYAISIVGCLEGESPSSCSDEDGWVDLYGDGCEYEIYDEPGCPTYGNLWDAGNGTANKSIQFKKIYACCYCGGGVENPVDPPVSVPSVNTAPPVPAPSAISSSPTTYEVKCEDISTRGDCNQTFGCSWAKQRGSPRAVLRHVLLKSVILVKSVSASEKDVNGIIVKILARGAWNEKMLILCLKASDQHTNFF